MNTIKPDFDGEKNDAESSMDGIKQVPRPMIDQRKQSEECFYTGRG